MGQLIWQGTTAQAAYDMIYAACYGGQTSVSYIVNGPTREKDGTLNPNFRSVFVVFQLSTALIF
jgi:hypothetical protein